ncbi:hypothetical protein CARUB_v10019101mg, partial [Capsella rubella]
EDRLSLLPNPLLSRVLLHLPTKDVVKTSVLSSRWRSVWRYVPGLDLDDRELPDYSSFVNFVDRFVEFLRSNDSPIAKLKLTSKRVKSDPSAIKPWVKEALVRKLQHLEINYSTRFNSLELLPIMLFACPTLVCLRLFDVAFNELNHVSLPRLKTMHLEEVKFTNHAAIETLIASCPVLEDLSIVQDDLKVIRVVSQTITSINLVRDTNHQDNEKWEVLIHTPRLKYLSLKDKKSSSFIIYKMSPSAKVDIAVDFNVKGFLDPNDLEKRNSIGHFFKNISSSVRDMIICWETLKVIHQYLKLETLPQFPIMSHLHAKIFVADLEMLPILLRSCPNLKTLILELNVSTNKKERTRFSYVPWCFYSSLESVEMKTPISEIGLEVEVIKYFLENSRILKKLTLRLAGRTMKEESLIFMELLNFPRRSSVCEVHVAGLEETMLKL